MKNPAKFAPLIQIGGVCLLWLGVAGALRQGPTQPQEAPLFRSTAAPESRFVFADLDGDQRPDLALVETRNLRSSRTDYSIHVKLSHGAESAIPVQGPMGGLRVAARDVNGDDNLDLIVTANLDGGFLEVLLNDGSGNFSVASPGEYAGVANGTEGKLEAQRTATADLALLASLRISRESGPMPSRELPFTSSSGSSRKASVDPVVEGCALSRQGRSPPAASSPS